MILVRAKEPKRWASPLNGSRGRRGGRRRRRGIRRGRRRCTMGQNQVILRHQKFTFPWAREWANEWAVRANERTDGRAVQYLRLYSCLFQTIVQSLSLPQPTPNSFLFPLKCSFFLLPHRRCARQWKMTSRPGWTTRRKERFAFSSARRRCLPPKSSNNSRLVVESIIETDNENYDDNGNEWMNEWMNEFHVENGRDFWEGRLKGHLFFHVSLIVGPL